MRCLVNAFAGGGGRKILFVSAGRDSIRVTPCIEAGFFRALNLRNAAVMNDELHYAEAERLDFFLHDAQPLGRKFGFNLGDGMAHMA